VEALVAEGRHADQGGRPAVGGRRELTGSLLLLEQQACYRILKQQLCWALLKLL
jgi:hypothetical protein